MIWFLIVLGIIGIDQLTKYLVIRNISLGQEIVIIKKFFYLTYLENRGAAWSILQDATVFFIIVTLILSVVMIYIMLKNKQLSLRLSLSFILGGAIGNLIDRILKASVTDFLGVLLGSYRYPIFNLADCFIVIGMFILAFNILFFNKDEKLFTK